jgi:signal transduction histidine kinase
MSAVVESRPRREQSVPEARVRTGSAALPAVKPVVPPVGPVAAPAAPPPVTQAATPAAPVATVASVGGGTVAPGPGPAAPVVPAAPVPPIPLRGELAGLLGDAARLACEAVGAARAAVLLLDPSGALVPAVTVARDESALGRSRLRALPPLLADPALVGSGVAVDDVRSAAIAPLVAGGVLLGALVVDHAMEPHCYHAAELRLLEAMATPLRLLLGAGEVVDAAHQRQRLLDHVARAGRDLGAARTPYEVLQTGMDAVVAVLGATSCSVNVVAADGTVDTLASRGARQPEPGRHPVEVLTDLVAPRPRAWGGPAAVHVPMNDAFTAPAFMVVGRERPTAPEPADLDAARSLAGQTWLAYERAAESATLARRVEVLDLLAGLAAGEPGDLRAVVDRLAPAVRAATGAELIDTFVCDPATARALAAPVPTRPVGVLVRRWRHDGDPRPVADGGLLALPMLAGADVVGVLRARPGETFDGRGELLLGTVATALAGVVSRAALRSALARGERALAVAAERERVGRDLHDTLAQQLSALRMELGCCADAATDAAVAARLHQSVRAVSRASHDLDLAVQALSFLEHSRRGLLPSLRGLVRSVAETSDVAIELRVNGTARPLAGGRDEALARVAHEALRNVVRWSRASTATVTVSYAAERTSLVIRDDGTGMSARSDEQPGLHFGLRAMQRRMAEVGGGLEVANFRPHGVCLHAWVGA